jgi:hypothetical protein
MTKRKISIYELYANVKKMPTPTQMFITKISEVTHRSPTTVKMWLSGVQKPDVLAQMAIADAFKLDVETLFSQENINVK